MPESKHKSSAPSGAQREDRIEELHSPVGRLLNIGPASARMLESINIFSRADLERVGSVLAYRALKDAHPGVSLNLLYALYGALSGERWDQLTEETRSQLKREVLEAKQVPPGASESHK